MEQVRWFIVDIGRVIGSCHGFSSLYYVRYGHPCTGLRKARRVPGGHNPTQIISRFFFKIVITQKVSNIHLVTKDFKIVPLTDLLKLFLVWRVIGGGGGSSF